MKKILVIPNNKEDMEELLTKNITGLILPIEHLSVNSKCFFSIDNAIEIANKTNKEICISINKVMMNHDIPLLEKVLIKASHSKISKVLFYDLAIININNKLHLNLELVVFQDHLNTSISTNLFYQKRGVHYSVISNDITLDEINEISKYQPLMMIVYGYLPMFYSRRYLITNYLNFLKKEKKKASYSIKDDKKNTYIIEEEENGTTIYTKEPINLINKIDKLNIEYCIINTNYIEREIWLKVLEQWINNKKDNQNHYLGFLEKKTVYKVEDYE